MNEQEWLPRSESVTTRYPRSHLAACMLPWTPDWQLDVPAFEQHIQDTLAAGFSMVYLMGTAGEGYALTDRQFQEAVTVFAAQMNQPGLTPQVGLISLSLGQVLERIAFCVEQGITMFQISLPCWGELDDRELVLFFQTVCGRFPECRFLHYNLPRAKRVLTGSDYRRICDSVPNLVATKNSSTDYAVTADLMRHAPELQHFFLNGNFAFGAMLGECSLLCSYCSLFPQTCWEFYHAGGRGDLRTLFRIHHFLHDTTQRLFGHCLRGIDGRIDKTMVWLRRPRFPRRLLPPYLALSEAESERCRRIFAEEFQAVE